MATRMWVLVGVCSGLGLVSGCTDEGPGTSTAPAGERRPRSEPVEWVGLSATLPTATTESVRELLDGVFGAAARDGRFAPEQEIQPGVFLRAMPDSRTPEQAVVEVDMRLADEDERRIVARVPVGFDYGAIYLDTVDAALARAAEVEAADPGGMSPFHLTYLAQSVQGGSVGFTVRFEGGRAQLEIETNATQTSLDPGFVNQAAFAGEPTEVIAGTVWFELTRDEFDFFSKRAYGVTEGAAQNFDDFRLRPHEWLRLTVTPMLEERLIDVAFEVVTQDGRRVPLARAPASLIAGQQFRENVFRMVDNMNDQERAEPGSSTPWTVPFHYDDPEGGGVVRVIANGRAGIFNIAYAVESPIHRLRDVDFLPYQGEVVIPDMIDPVETSCADVGSTDALRGKFRVRFDASDTVRGSDALTDPLRGNVWGNVYRAEDVNIGGPVEGAEAVASFAFEGVDATVPGEGMEYLIDAELPTGDYQILGFMDIDGNGAETTDPDEGDPVTLPIGSYRMECAEQPVVVEFALLLPPGR